MASAHFSPTWVLEPVHVLARSPAPGRIPVIWPGTSPVKVRFCVQVPSGTTGDGEGTVFTVVGPQAMARTTRATMPTTRSMWSNVSRGSALGKAHPGHAISRGRLSDRRGRRDRDLAHPPWRLL